MTRFALFAVVLSLGLLACAPDQNSSATTASKVVTLEVTGNQVLMLDNKEVHVDYLNSVLSGLNNKFDISAKLSISADAPMGIVNDVQQALNQNAVRVTSDEE